MRGRKALATAEEREAVYRLAGAGASLRDIAAQVFGDRRLKDRVVRLLRGRKDQDAGATLEELMATLDALERAGGGEE